MFIVNLMSIYVVFMKYIIVSLGDFTTSLFKKKEKKKNVPVKHYS